MESLKKIENYSKALYKNSKAAIEVAEITKELAKDQAKFVQLSSVVNFEGFTEITLENSEDAQRKAYDLYSKAFDEVKAMHLNMEGDISDHPDVSKYVELHIVISDIIYRLGKLKEAEKNKSEAQALYRYALSVLYEQCVDGSKVSSEEISNASIASILDAHLGPIAS